MREYDAYNPDPWAEELVRMYDEERASEEYPNSSYYQNLILFPTETWTIECEEIMSDLGFENSQYKIKLFPDEKLKTLAKRYQLQNIDIDLYGQLVSRDPLPDYVPKTGNVVKELYDLGRTLGLMGEIGRYYFLIPDINFSRGLWQGQVEKAISESDFDALKQVQEDMEFFKKGSFSQEFKRINNNMFNLNDNSYTLEDSRVFTK